jgi:hypothetical protein
MISNGLVDGFLRLAKKLLGPQLYLETRLKKMIRKEILSGVNIDKILYVTAKQVMSEAKIPEGAGEVKNVENALVDRLFERFPKFESKVYGIVAAFFEDKGIDSEKAKILTKGGEGVSEEEEIGKILDKYKKEISTIIAGYLKSILFRLGKEYSLQKRREIQDEAFKEHGEYSDDEGELTDVSMQLEKALQTLDVHDIEEELTAKYKIEKDLIKRTTDHIEQKVPEMYRGLCMKILQDMLLPENKKTLKELEKETGVNYVTISRWVDKLKKLLREFYLTQKDVMEYVGPHKKEDVIEIPSYRTYLKEHPEEQASFREWLHDNFQKDVPESTLKVLDYASQGKGRKEISDLGISITNVDNILRKYVNSPKGFEGWYKKTQMKTEKEGSYMAVREFIKDLLGGKKKEGTVDYDSLKVGVIIHHKTGPISDPTKEKKEEKKEELGGNLPSKPGAFDKVMDRVFKAAHPRVTVTVEFSSKFNSTGDHYKNEEGKWETDPEFKYIKYHALIRERVRGKLLIYKSEQDLTKDGNPTGKLTESLTYDGQPLDDFDLLKRIHKGMDEQVKGHGLLPGHGNFSIHYENIYHRPDDPNWHQEPELYGGVHDFIQKHQKIYTPDEKRKEWEEARKKHEQRKDYGEVGDYETVQKNISLYKGMLKKEKDSKVRGELTKKLKEWEERFEKNFETRDEVLKEDWDLLGSLGDDIKEHYKENVEEPTLKPQGPRVKEGAIVDYDMLGRLVDYDSLGKTADMSVIAIEFPMGTTEGSKNLIALFKKYNLDDLSRWVEPHQLTLLLKKFKNEWDYRLNKLSAEHSEVGVKRLHEDAENLKKWMPDYLKDLKVRLADLRKKSPSDYAILDKNRDLSWLEDTSKVKEIEDTAENLFRAEKVLNAFPGPKGDNAQKLVHKFNALGLSKNPNPSGWLVPSDLMVMARTFSHMIAEKIHKEMGEKKTKGIGKDEWKADRERIRKEYEGDLNAVVELFPDFLKDLKERQDSYAKDYPLDHKGLKNVGWLNNEGKVKSLLDDIKEELTKVVTKEPGKIDQGATNIIEHTKFDAIQGFLETNKLGFRVFGARLSKASLKPGGGDPDISKYKKDKEDVSKQIEEATRKLNAEDLQLTEEETKSLEASRSEWIKTFNDMNSIISMKVAVPAIHPAKILTSFNTYFSKMFSDFSHYIWMREKYSSEEEISYDELVLSEDFDFEKISKEEAVPESIGAAEMEGRALIDDIYHECLHLYGLRIKAKEGIKSGLGMLRRMLQRLFIITTYITTQRDDKTEKGEVVPEKGKSAAEPKVYVPKDDGKKPQKTFEEAREKYIIPESFFHEAENLIRKMKENKNEKVRALAPTAQSEFDTLVESLTELHKKGFTDKEIGEIAKKSGISPQKAAIRVRGHQNILNKVAMDAYVTAWGDVLRHAEEGLKLQPKEKSEMGNKHHKMYEELHALVKNLKGKHLSLQKLADDPELPEIPSRGIPTAEKMKEDIMRASIPRKMELTDKQKELAGEPSDMSPEEKAHFWKVEMTEAGFANGFADSSSSRGGGGGKGKSRPKAMKIPPPSGVKEEMEKELVKNIKTKSAIDIVKNVIALQVKHVMKHADSLPEGEVVLEGDLIDGLVSELKSLHTLMMNLKIGPSSSQWDPPKTNIPTYNGPGGGGGQLKYTGTPDISIDGWKEAKEVFDKYIDIFNVINHFIKPDKVSVPSKNIKTVKPTNKDLPPGLIDWYNHFSPQKEVSNPKEQELKHKPLPHIPSDAERLYQEKMKKNDPPEHYGKPPGNQELKLPKHPGFEYEKEINPREKESSSLYDYPTQMSANVASKFAGVVLPKEEIDAIMS